MGALAITLAATAALLLGSFAIACCVGAAFGALAAMARVSRWVIGAALLLLACIPFFALPFITWFLAASHHIDLVSPLFAFLFPACTLALLQVPLATAYFERRFTRAGNATRDTVPAGILRLFAWYLPAIVGADVIVELVYGLPGVSRDIFGLSGVGLEGIAFLAVIGLATIALRALSGTGLPERSNDDRRQGDNRARYAIVVLAALSVLAAFSIAGAFLERDAFSIDEAHWQGRALPPCLIKRAACHGHILGTDDLGRDILSRLVVGGRTTLQMSTLAVLIELFIVAALGALARRTRTARAVVRAVAGAVSSLPAWLVIVAASTALFSYRPQPTATFLLVAIAAACLTAPVLLLRNLDEPLCVGDMTYALGDLATIIVLVSTVDFFGFGTQPPTPSWGNMFSGAETTIEYAWWASAFPVGSIFLTLLAIRGAQAFVAPSTSLRYARDNKDALRSG